MKFEVGKTYVTRGGKKARIELYRPTHPITGERLVHCFVGYVEGCSDPLTWTADGYLLGDNVPRNSDLIAEYGVPRKWQVEVFTYESENGGVFHALLGPTELDSKLLLARTVG